MKRTTILPILFAVVAAAQIAVPAYMIARHENTLGSGERFLFLCSTFGPVEAMGGQYVSLDFVHDDAVAGDTRFEPGETAYAEIRVGEDGYARPGRLHRKPPGEGPYLRVRVGRHGARGEGEDREPAAEPDSVDVIYPFHRYFVEESRAEEMRETYRERVRSSEVQQKSKTEIRALHRAEAVVRVLDGYAVIEELELAIEEAGDDPDSVAVPVR